MEEELGSGDGISPLPLEREKTVARRARTKPDLSSVEPKEITNKTKHGENTFSARSRKPVPIEAPMESVNPWSPHEFVARLNGLPTYQRIRRC